MEIYQLENILAGRSNVNSPTRAVRTVTVDEGGGGRRKKGAKSLFVDTLNNYFANISSLSSSGRVSGVEQKGSIASFINSGIFQGKEVET